MTKRDGSFRFCTDFRKVNDKTKSDSFPIPRMSDCIDQIGNAKFVSTFDMLKGYWQVPLTQRAHKISTFVTLLRANYPRVPTTHTLFCMQFSVLLA